MRRWFERVHDWRARRELRSLEKWERDRAQGKAWFVFRTALTYGLVVIGVTDVLDHLYDGTTEFSISLLRIIWYSIAGIVAGFFAWSNMEDKYQRALYDARLASSGGNALPPNEIKLVSS